MLLNLLDYAHNLFLTWNQVKELNGSLLKGEEGQLDIFTKMVNVEVYRDERTETKQCSFLRNYMVFNVAQYEKLSPDLVLSSNEELPVILSCASIVAGMKNAPAIVHKRVDAFYHLKGTM